MPMESAEEERMSLDTSRKQRVVQKRFEIVLLMVLGALVGFSVKTEAVKKITMGADDYLLSQQDRYAYDLNAMQRDLLAKGDGASIAGPQMTGGSCEQ